MPRGAQAMKFGILYNIDYHEDVHGSPQGYFKMILEQSVLLEQLGFDAVWYSEHHCSGYSFGNPAVIAAAAATCTKTIRLGIGVSLVPLHNPIKLAEEYGMVDAISGGRLEYGVGRGYLMQEYDFFNVPLGESHGRYREGVDLISRIWQSKGPLSYEGEFFKFQNYHYFPTPAQRPTPPIYASAGGTPESFTWAGSRGYHLGTALFLPNHEAGRTNIGAYRDALAANGFDRRSREVMAVTQMYCAPTKAEAMRDGGQYTRNYYSFFADVDAQSPNSTVPKFYKAPDIEAMDRNNQVLLGEPGELVDRIGKAQVFFDLDFLLLEVAQGGAPPANVNKTLRLFGEKVLPQFKKGSKAVAAE
jgi:alkanesulfonate monooxygenase SsuD/methylene tetrahydromethanopterin reductase-like flavin-dependent oxidoreductase (luciferase family)